MIRNAVLLLILIPFISFAQEQSKEQLLAAKEANNFIYEGNKLLESEDFISAEMAYRKAINKQYATDVATYNLGTAYIKNGITDEALYRLEQATKVANSKAEKHKAFHNIGNVLMQNKKCKEAVEAYKNALRNDPTDDETRYNLAVAKKCAEQQQDQDNQNKDDKQDQENKDQNKENQDQENKDNKDNKENQENKDNKDKEGDNKEDKKDEGDQDKEDKKDGEDKKDDQGNPKDEKNDQGEGDKGKKKEQPKPQPKPGQLSPQQIKNLLEAMNNQEQKVQEKMNAEKQKGVKIKTEKDW